MSAETSLTAIFSEATASSSAFAKPTREASVFKASPDGFLDASVGLRLRNEVYGKGNTRDVGESVEKFLGRPRSTQPFLEYVGIKK